MSEADERNPLERAQAGSDWVEELLALFFAVGACVSTNELPQPVLKAWADAEEARQRL